MGEHEAPPKRWILIRMFQHAIARTEAEIAELKGQGLFVRDASGPDDTHEPATPPPPVPAPGGNPDNEEQSA